MILIEHPNLDDIKNTYSNNVVSEITKRILLLDEVINLLNSKNKIKENDIKGKFYQYNKALRVIVDDKNLTARRKKGLVININNARKSINKFKHRIKIIQFDTISLSEKSVLKNLITGNPKILLTLQSNAIKKLKLDEKDELFNYLFSYDDFYQNFIKNIGVYLNINVCPYCNRQYITNVQDINGERIIGPTFDHFFSQDENPLLKLSFYNLIPSCYTCNSNLKGKIPFKFNTHLHPYFNEMGKSAVFDFDLDTSITTTKNKIDFKPTLKINFPIGSKEYKKLEGSINVFKLREIYATHNDIVEEIHEKFDESSQYYLISLKPILDKLSTNEKEYYRFRFGNYFDSKDFNKRPLAKLTKDIYNKMKQVYENNKSYRTK